MNIFSNEMLIIILSAFIICILISIIFKKIRKYVYSSFITTFIISLLGRNGFELECSFPLIEKLINYNYSLFERLEALLLTRKDLLSYIVNFENEFKYMPHNVFDYLVINVKMIAISFLKFAERVKININVLIVALKYQFVRRTNISRLKMYYRL